MLHRIDTWDTGLITETSRFLLGTWRDAFSQYYSDEELRDIYDESCTPQFIKYTTLLSQRTFVVSLDIAERVNGVIFWKRIEEQNARIISCIVVWEPRKWIGKALIQKYEGEFPNVDFLAANIKEANIPSQRLFESQGYKHEGYTNSQNITRMYYKDRVPFLVE